MVTSIQELLLTYKLNAEKTIYAVRTKLKKKAVNGSAKGSVKYLQLPSHPDKKVKVDALPCAFHQAANDGDLRQELGVVCVYIENGM